MQSKSEEKSTGFLIRFLLIALFDIAIGWFIIRAFGLGFTQLGSVLAVIAVMLNVIFLHPKAFAYRWMALGLSFLILFVIYPLIFTVYVAFTNYGDGHLLTKEQALEDIQKVTYLPENAKSYSWTAFKSADGTYALWLISPEGETFLAKPGEEIVPARPGESGVGEADSKGIPTTIEGYERQNPLRVASDKELPNIKFGLEGDQTIQISSPSLASELEIATSTMRQRILCLTYLLVMCITMLMGHSRPRMARRSPRAFGRWWVLATLSALPPARLCAARWYGSWYGTSSSRRSACYQLSRWG